MTAQRIFRVLHKAGTIITATGCMLVALLPWIGNGGWWMFHILGIGFPFLLLGLVVFTSIWFFSKSRWKWFGLVVILLSAQQLSYLIGLHPWRAKRENPGTTLRVLSWNVARWDEKNKEKRGGESYRRLMLDYIEMQEADVLCLQEYFECTDPRYYEATIPALKKAGFPYVHFFPTTSLFDGSFRYGLAIFSRFPIIEARSFNAGVRIHSEGVCYADIEKDGQRVRVFNAHLESPGFSRQNFTSTGSLDQGSDFFQKIARAYSVRGNQARETAALIRSSPWPVVVCMDLGDVPNSFAYATVRKGLNDAFLETGFGFGATYRFLSPTLRIDYLLHSSDLRIVNLRSEKLIFSDHFPIIGDFDIDLQ